MLKIRRSNCVLWTLVLLMMTRTINAQSGSEISLAGQWRFAVDRDGAGEAGKLFARDLPLQARLPGSMHEQGLGDPPSLQTKWTAGLGAQFLSRAPWSDYAKEDDFKTPFWLTPLRYYVGAAWYQRDVEIPASWAGKRIVLILERPHWESTVWVDETKIGMQNSLGVPHQHDLTQVMTPGKHRLTLRIDNSVKIPVGNDAHSVSDQTQGNWNGIVGAIKLVATDKVWLDDIQVYPSIEGRKAKVTVNVGNLSGAAGSGTITLSAASANTASSVSTAPKDFPITWDASGGRAELEYPLNPATPLWDEFDPALVKLEVQLRSSAGNDSRSITFGLREFGAKGTQFVLNGRPIMLRGTLECCIFPLTGYPPTDVESWKKEIRTAQSYGLNHLRFHSWCPPEAAFVAADELGMYVQIEASAWTGYDRPAVLPWITDEIDRMLKAYGNHPSFVMLAPSNEPSRTDAQGVMAGMMKMLAEHDPRHLYTAGAGWPQLATNEYHVLSSPRMQASNELRRAPQTASDYRAQVARYTVPIVGHEIGQWSAFPDLDETSKYTGSMRATNLEIFRDILNKSGQGDLAKQFTQASGHLQALLYKEEIENHLRTPGIGGFQLLDLHDFPGQGTAPVGVLDAFWDSKGYIAPQQHRRYCGPTVPLARMSKRVFTTDEEFTASAEVAHFGAKNLENVKTIWRVRDAAGKILQSGSLNPATVKTGGQTSLGEIHIGKGNLPAPAKLNLEISLDGVDAANDWDFWVYPSSVATDAPTGVRIATSLDDEAMNFVNGGGKLLLVPPSANIAGNALPSFSPLFWNNITFPGGNRVHTLGILCDPKHPALAEFPTDFHSNWQWWELTNTAKPMILTDLPKDLHPLVQTIDDWLTCRKLGLAIEAKVGQGKLILTSMDLTQNLESRPVARQMRRSLLDYMTTADFSPRVTLTDAQLRSLVK